MRNWKATYDKKTVSLHTSCICRSVGRAWQSLKAELRYRSEAHSKFAKEVCSLNL